MNQTIKDPSKEPRWFSHRRHMFLNGLRIRVNTHRCGSGSCAPVRVWITVVNPVLECEGVAEDKAHAICLAALQAVGYEG